MEMGLGLLDPAQATSHGRRSALARLLWVGVAIMAVGLFCASIPARWLHLSTPDHAVRAGLARLGLAVGAYAGYRLALDVALALGFVAVGTLVFWRKADERTALFASLMLVLFGTHGNWPARVAALPQWAGAIKGLSLLAWSLFGLFLYTFPDGRFVPAWARVPAAVAVACQPFWILPPTSSFYPTNWPGPLYGLLAVGSGGTALVAQAYRYRRVSGPIQRQQTKWLVAGCTIVCLIGALLALLAALFPSFRQPGGFFALFAMPTSELLLLVIPLSIGIAILRHRLWDIDIIINRTLVYAALTACVVGLYAGVVGGTGLLFRVGDNPAVSLVAAGLIAVVFQPLRERLQRGVNRLLWGERDDPYAVLARLDRRLVAALAPEAVLPAIVETVAQALKLPYAAIALAGAGGDTIAAAYGRPVPDPLRLPLVYQGEPVGELRLGPRAPGEGFGRADRRLIEDLARHAGAAAHAVRLTADLQRSRERLVAAREEERRRLRRDLHDGLGPTLASLAQRLDLARALVPREPEAAVALLGDLKGQIRGTVADIRRLVYGLRPPTLDEFGLVTALREQAARLGEATGLRVTVEAPEPLPPLPAAVEVAAYRIATEALTNVARHAAAGACRVRLAVGAALELEIADDGRGLPPDYRPGVGLASMRERAAELGGSCAITASSAGGTRVRARLPLPEE